MLQSKRGKYSRTRRTGRGLSFTWHMLIKVTSPGWEIMFHIASAKPLRQEHAVGYMEADAHIMQKAEEPRRNESIEGTADRQVGPKRPMYEVCIISQGEGSIW